MWVKICGITRPEDAAAAFEAGADAIGLNFVAGPRKVTVAAAERILDAVPPDRPVVGLVALGRDGVDPSINGWLEPAGVRRLQVYGEVSALSVGRLIARGFEVLVVHRPETDGRPVWLEGPGGEPRADRLFAVVLDAVPPAPGAGKSAMNCGTERPDETLKTSGGTGRALDWPAVAEARNRRAFDGWPPIVLAGGLTSRNVSRAIAIVRPWGVDVSSGVEISPGRKDHCAMADFIGAAKALG